MSGKKMPRIWGVDFDGTLCRNRWPRIGAQNTKLIDFLQWRRMKGEAVILITMREGELLDRAVEWCRDRGLEFDAVNDNLHAVREMYGGKLFGENPRKIFAHIYIDDRNLELSHAMSLFEKGLDESAWIRSWEEEEHEQDRLFAGCN